MIRILTGGQTGVDQGAAAAALRLGVPVCGAYGRPETENGPMPDWLREHLTPTSLSYRERTRLNVRNANVVVLVCPRAKAETPGTIHTQACAREFHKPCFPTNLGSGSRAGTSVKYYLEGYRRKVETEDKPFDIMVAGPRLSLWPEAFDVAYALTAYILRRLGVVAPTPTVIRP